MKFKLLSLAALCFFGLQANAQTEKGKNLIGGSFSYFSATSEQSGASTSSFKQKEYVFGPTYGHFISNNFAIGLGVSFGKYENTNSYIQSTMIGGSYYDFTYTVESKQTKASVSPFARYYVDINDKFKFFGQFNASIELNKTNNPAFPNSPSVKSTAFGASLSPSLAFFPAKKFAIELGFSLISYNRTLDRDNAELKAEGFSFGFDSFNPSLGVNFHF